jgi:hypothetical protein
VLALTLGSNSQTNSASETTFACVLTATILLSRQSIFEVRFDDGQRLAVKHETA